MKNFISWLQERKLHGVPANDQVMTISDANLELNPVPVKTRPHCLAEYTVPKSPWNKVLSWNILSKTFRQTGEPLLVDFLKGKSNENKDIEILHIDLEKSNHFSHNNASEIPIPYGVQLTALADKVAKELGPFVAIHWRMETIKKTQKLVLCAEQLINLLSNNSNYQNHKIFLLTDYPHSFSLEQQMKAIEGISTDEELHEWLKSTSDTFLFSSFTTNHHLAIQYLYSHREFIVFETAVKSLGHTIENWKVLPIPTDLVKQSTNLNQTGLFDSGWLGILDKLMAIRSEYFLAGKGRVCARASTFTKQIVEERKHLSLNDVQYFGH